MFQQNYFYLQNLLFKVVIQNIVRKPKTFQIILTSYLHLLTMLTKLALTNHAIFGFILKILVSINNKYIYKTLSVIFNIIGEKYLHL